MKESTKKSAKPAAKIKDIAPKKDAKGGFAVASEVVKPGGTHKANTIHKPNVIHKQS